MSPTPQSQAASHTVTPSTAPAFTPTQRATLRALRARYRASRDVFDSKELARLRFVRWLYQTGRLAA